MDRTSPSSSLDEIPIGGNPYYVRIAKTGQLDSSHRNLKVSGFRQFLTRYKHLLMFAVLSIALILSICEGLILILNSSETSLMGYNGEQSMSDSDRYEAENPYEELLREIESSAYSVTEASRSKRAIRSNECEEKIAYCKSNLHFANLIENAFEQRDRELDKYLNSLNDQGPKGQSMILDIIDCLRCKSRELKLAANKANETKGRNSIAHNSEASSIERLIKLLDAYKSAINKETDKEQSSVSGESNEIESPETIAGMGDRPEVVSAESVSAVSMSTSQMTEFSSTSTEKDSDDSRQQSIDNVTGISSDSLMTARGRKDGTIANPEELTVDTADFRRANLNFDRRIVVNDALQAKGNAEGNQMVIPTAETIKSSQQLQLTPTMSWMQYPVCFYGPPASGSMKQSNQVIYPISSPAAPYPVTMPQQRGQAFPNSANQGGSNYVQVQAQSVQLMPLQGFPGQRIGPTGPGQIPFFGGNQSPSGTANSARAPYYCTYIPAPAFQYPAIPGVSEYQRSSSNQIGEGQTEGKPIWNIQQSLLPVCPAGEVRCEDGTRCVSKVKWCDGHIDCNDASDETRCSCRDRITKDRLCDGYFDCPQGEDELACFGCPRTSFSCGDWDRRYSSDSCVPLSQRCDGIKQCPNGKDEIDCAILSSTYVENKNVFTVSYAEGYLHKNLEGRWYPVCTPTISWAIDACRSEVGPDMSGVPDIKLHTVPDTGYQGPYLAEVKGEVKVLKSCLSRIAHVRCPPMPCGSRVFSRQESMRTFNAYENDDIYLGSPPNGTSSILSDVAVENAADDTLVGSELRVVGGRASQPKAWPFLVAIYRDGYFHCGGVIVNELWILTAAHCLDGYTEHYFEVQAGVLRRFSFSPMAQSRRAKYTIIHEKYRSKDMQNDIGMMMLDEPLYFNRWVRPICLPQNNNPAGSKEPMPGSTCIAIGWGATRERGPDPDHLREVEVPILPVCTHLSDQNEASICAGYPQGGRDACQGDSGGPLMCRSFFSESQWYVAGIVSHGEGCGRPNEPGAYTRVSHFGNWIEQVSNGHSIPPIGRSPLDRCPGFNCEGGLGKCLPIEKRCNRMVDCLDGEDEVNCPRQSKYTLFRQAGNDSEILSSEESSTEKLERLIVEKTSAPYEETTQALFEAESSSGANTEASNLEVTAATAFTCKVLIQSIPINKLCDKVVDCEDGTDESNCTCKDFLYNFRPTAICDGILDCRDETDEEDCGICNESEFLCRRSGVCVPLAAKCDGKYDCQLQEDELDCFALTNGKRVRLDAEGRPMLKFEGILTRNVNGQWRPTCHLPMMHQQQPTRKLIGQNMCTVFGFLGLESVNLTKVKDEALETVSGNEETAMLHEPAELTDSNRECPGLYIRCRPVLNSSDSRFLSISRKTGIGSYVWPWIAAIFVNGNYRCSATLLDYEWLLASAKCFQVLSPEKDYIVAVLGYGPSFLYANGPHEQVSRIDGIKYVDNSVSVLLHVTPTVNMTRYIQPLLLEKKIYPATDNDTCVAIGTNDRFETTSMFLRPVVSDCQNCNRCFINVSAIEDCMTNETSDWSGTIFCHGQKGWYPAGAFYEKDGPCSFGNQQNLTSIDYINPHYMEALEDEINTIPEPACNGFRCSIGKCIPLDRVCDGIQDCRDGEDEDPNKCERHWQECENDVNGCSTCRRSELRCGNGRCVDKSAFGDGMEDCNDGTDEPETRACAEYLKLTRPELICDGIRHCLDKTDESPETCSCRDDSFNCTPLSENGKCIPQDFVCDGAADCDGGEDEAECLKLNQTDPNRPQSGEIIRRSFGIWHTECFSLPIETGEQATTLCKSMGYSSGTIYDNSFGNTSEPLVPIRNHFFIVKLNRWTWLTMQNNATLLELGKPQGDCYRAFVSCAQ